MHIYLAMSEVYLRKCYMRLVIRKAGKLRFWILKNYEKLIFFLDSNPIQAPTGKNKIHFNSWCLMFPKSTTTAKRSIGKLGSRCIEV